MTSVNTIESDILMVSQTIIVCENHWQAVLSTDDFGCNDVDRVLEDVFNAISDKLEDLIYADANQFVGIVEKLLAVVDHPDLSRPGDDVVLGQGETGNRCSVSGSEFGLESCES